MNKLYKTKMKLALQLLFICLFFLSPQLSAESQWKSDVSLVDDLLHLSDEKIKDSFPELVPEQERVRYAILLAKRLVFSVQDDSKAKIFLKIAESELEGQSGNNEEWATINMLYMTTAERSYDYRSTIKYGIETLRLLRNGTSQHIGRFSYILNRLSDSFYAIGDYDNSVKYASELVREAKSANDAAVQAKALFSVAESQYKLAALKEAEQAATEAYSLYSSLGDTKGLGHAMKVLGSVYGAQGDIEKAKESYSAAIGHYKKINYSHGIANCSFNLGLKFKTSKKYKEALEYLEDASFYYMNSGSASGAGMAKMEQGMVYQELNQLDKTALLYDEARRLLTKTNKLARLAQLEYYAADFYVKTEQTEKARQALNKALDIYKKANNKRYIKYIEKRLKNLSMVNVDD